MARDQAGIIARCAGAAYLGAIAVDCAGGEDADVADQGSTAMAVAAHTPAFVIGEGGGDASESAIILCRKAWPVARIGAAGAAGSTGRSAVEGCHSRQFPAKFHCVHCKGRACAATFCLQRTARKGQLRSGGSAQAGDRCHALTLAKASIIVRRESGPGRASSPPKWAVAWPHQRKFIKGSRKCTLSSRPAASSIVSPPTTC